MYHQSFSYIYQVPHNTSVIVEIISRPERTTGIRRLHFSKNITKWNEGEGKGNEQEQIEQGRCS